MNKWGSKRLSVSISLYAWLTVKSVHWYGPLGRFSHRVTSGCWGGQISWTLWDSHWCSVLQSLLVVQRQHFYTDHQSISDYLLLVLNYQGNGYFRYFSLIVNSVSDILIPLNTLQWIKGKLTLALNSIRLAPNSSKGKHQKVRATSSSCGGLQPWVKTCFALPAKKGFFCAAVLAYFRPFSVFSNNLNNF